jgi:2'-5' RNA ligase
MMKNTLRIFIALSVDEPVVRFLKKLQRDIRSYGFTASWSSMDQVHLTLSFLGDLDGDRVPCLVRALEKAGEGCDGFTLLAGGVGVFPSPGRARVIWAGIKGEVQALAGLHGRLRDCLAREGFAPEAGRFVPHLTLARLKAQADPETVLGMIRDCQERRSETFACRSLGLWASERKSSGAVHTCLSRVPFGEKSGPVTPAAGPS